jgi:hypothetical protein
MYSPLKGTQKKMCDRQEEVHSRISQLDENLNKSVSYLCPKFDRCCEPPIQGQGSMGNSVPNVVSQRGRTGGALHISGIQNQSVSPSLHFVPPGSH